MDDHGQPAEGGTHPVVYVANGSHANYFFGPGRYATSTERFGVRITAGEFPFTGEFLDFTTSLEEGEKVFPELVAVPSATGGRWTGEWRWLNLHGEWGSLGVPRWLEWPLRVLPKGVRFRLSRRIWGAPASLPRRRNSIDPFTWFDRECEETPLHDSWVARQLT